MTSRGLFVCVILCASISCFCQTKSDSRSPLDSYRLAERFYNSADADEQTDSLALSAYERVIKTAAQHVVPDSILFDSYLKTGILLTGIQKDVVAIDRFLSAIHLNKNSDLVGDSLSFLPWLFAGSNYYNLFDIDSALFCFRQAEKIFEAHPGVPEPERLYNKMGVLYYQAGDYQKSIPYFRKALSLLTPDGGENAAFIINYKNNIASALRKLRRYPAALAIYESLLGPGIYRNEVLHNIGVTHLDAGEFTAALSYLKQVGYRTATLNNDLATAYLGLSKLDSAKNCLQRSLRNYVATPGKPNVDQARSLKLLGEIQMIQGQPELALRLYHQSISYIIPSFTDTLLSSNPRRFDGLYPFFTLFDVLAAKARAFEALDRQSTKNNFFLKNAFATYESALSLAGYMESVYGSDESKFFLKQNADSVYSAAIICGLILYNRTRHEPYKRQVFQIIETYKASVLQSSINDWELSTLEGIPARLVRKERSLKASLSATNLKIMQVANPPQLAELQRQSRDIELALSHVQQQLADNPFYHRLKFGADKLSAGSLQEKLLEQHDVLLSYYQTPKYLICFCISKDSVSFVLAKSDTLLKGAIQKLRLECSAPDGGSASLIARYSQMLYERVIAPVSAMIAKAEHLIIIPHAELNYIPFEIFINPQTNRLLIQDYAISYQYSANFMAVKQRPVKPYQVLSVAPFGHPVNGSRPSRFAPLSASYAEIEGLPGKNLFDAAGTKAAFLRFAPDFPVLHLATHALADDSVAALSYIAFYDNPEDADSIYRLYEQEVYHMDLTGTQLAILSACETGKGELMNGEGVISLSRAFSYAGCKSVITSFWNANDVSTAYISRKLHAYLQQGYPVDKALQMAKLNYLTDNSIAARFKKPVFWANFILIGDTRAVVGQNPGNKYWRVALIAIFLTMLLWGAPKLIQSIRQRKRR